MVVVAIAGGTGYLGFNVTPALLSHPSKPTVRVLARSRSERVQALEEQGAEFRLVDYKDPASVAAAVEGADVFISTIGTKEAGPEVKVPLMKAVLGVKSVKIIIPSEFGIDHRAVDFPQKDWDGKKAVMDVLTSQTEKKIISIYTGLFMEGSFGPWFGISIKNKYVEYIGSDEPVSYTSLSDVGRATAEIVAKAAASPAEVPAALYLRICGDSVRYSEVATIFGEINGTAIEVRHKNLAQFKETTLDGDRNTAACLRFLMGQGDLNHSKDCGNEWVNPGGKKWTWTTVKDFAEEIEGKPFGGEV
ncbi:NAD(P)-binding protein [Calocera cornea HHB12733]|uniref:NAD(P)-binding protein n=1 Tax=Calocera cornea HHB12733 TaxID=1353952 RepID=A0A165JLH5_9BASI|nr:NAD(P)-binding protein [Calocera cornea HHB12733]